MGLRTPRAASPSSFLTVFCYSTLSGLVFFYHSSPILPPFFPHQVVPTVYIGQAARADGLEGVSLVIISCSPPLPLPLPPSIIAQPRGRPASLLRPFCATRASEDLPREPLADSHWRHLPFASLIRPPRRLPATCIPTSTLLRSTSSTLTTGAPCQASPPHVGLLHVCGAGWRMLCGGFFYSVNCIAAIPLWGVADVAVHTKLSRLRLPIFCFFFLAWRNQACFSAMKFHQFRFDTAQQAIDRLHLFHCSTHQPINSWMHHSISLALFNWL